MLTHSTVSAVSETSEKIAVWVLSGIRWNAWQPLPPPSWRLTPGHRASSSPCIKQDAADAITTWTARPDRSGRNDAIVDDGQRIGRAASGRAQTAKPPTGLLIEWLETQDVFGSISAVGHRLVHGLARTEPAQITSDVLAELHRATPYAPDHLPREIELIEAFRAALSRPAAGGLLRHRISRRHAAGRQAAADSAALLREGRPAVRVSWPVLRIPDRRARPYRGTGSRPRARDPRASGQRREPGRRAGRHEASTPAWASRPQPAWS